MPPSSPPGPLAVMSTVAGSTRPAMAPTLMPEVLGLPGPLVAAVGSGEEVVAAGAGPPVTANVTPAPAPPATSTANTPKAQGRYRERGRRSGRGPGVVLSYQLAPEDGVAPKPVPASAAEPKPDGDVPGPDGGAHKPDGRAPTPDEGAP